MYGWLSDVGGDSSQVVTANRRLARVLAAEYATLQVADGRSAWQTPVILSLPDWLGRLFERSDTVIQMSRINAQQSRLLWERLLRDEIDNQLVNVASLARQAREAWKRLHEWQVPFDEFAAAASNRDQHLFVRAATRYRQRLADELWIDDAQLPDLIIASITTGEITVPARLHVCGFDRLTPQLTALLGVLQQRGAGVERIAAVAEVDACLMAFDDADSELRAAGAWARACLDANPAECIGIVVSDLQQDAQRIARLVREGFVPGWQHAHAAHASAVNVSFGRPLNQYPAIAIALLVLRWLHRDLNSREISLLLRSACIGSADNAGRARLELKLRRVPDQKWTPELLLHTAGSRDDTADVAEWLRRLTSLAETRRSLTERRSPLQWAETLEAALREFGWPGSDPLNSEDFQLLNRWRDLLNEFARLDLVSPSMTLAEAAVQLTAMASEAIFQPELESAAVQVMGPLEAAGLVFDRLWIAGLTASRWPPARRPMALVSRRLQRHYAMPDADPSDTTDYARRVLDRLVASAASCLCSYHRSAGEAIEAPTALLDTLPAATAPPDPGWHAAGLCTRARSVLDAEDRTVPLAPEETVSGGAGTVQAQLSEPFAAFVYGRLGVSRIVPFAAGLTPMLRGNLIHGVLQFLYQDNPSQQDIVSWNDEERGARIARAVEVAFRRYEMNADKVVMELLALERDRVARLVAGVVDLDRGRDPFTLQATELALEFVLSGVPLRLRIDRIERRSDGCLEILDYKTGRPGKWLDKDGEPTDVQLVVYAAAMDEAVGALGQYIVDSREIGINGVGLDSMTAAEWKASLKRWHRTVVRAAEELAAGDVRLASRQTADEARDLGLLSRILELRNDA